METGARPTPAPNIEPPARAGRSPGNRPWNRTPPNPDHRRRTSARRSSSTFARNGRVPRTAARRSVGGVPRSVRVYGHQGVPRTAAAEKPADKPLTENPFETEQPEPPKPTETANLKRGDYSVGWIGSLAAFLAVASVAGWLLAGPQPADEGKQRSEARVAILAIGAALGTVAILVGLVLFYRWSESLVGWLDRGETQGGAMGADSAPDDRRRGRVDLPGHSTGPRRGAEQLRHPPPRVRVQLRPHRPASGRRSGCRQRRVRDAGAEQARCHRERVLFRQRTDTRAARRAWILR